MSEIRQIHKQLQEIAINEIYYETYNENNFIRNFGSSRVVCTDGLFRRIDTEEKFDRKWAI